MTPPKELAEFLDALEQWKAENGRAFPTWDEALSLMARLGYVRGPSQLAGLLAFRAGNAPHPAFYALRPQDVSGAEDRGDGWTALTTPSGEVLVFEPFLDVARAIVAARSEE